MAKREEKEIVWSDFARITFYQTLDFWIEHNKSKAYSRKLEKEIAKFVELISVQPEIGSRTSGEIRVATKGYFRIYYQNFSSHLLIRAFWDTRRNPSDLKL